MAKIVYRHTSDPNRDNNEYDVLLNSIHPWQVFPTEQTKYSIGYNSMFTRIEGDIVFDVVFPETTDGNITLWVKPLPNKRMTYGVIRITSDIDPNCYIDVTVYVNQNNLLGVNKYNQIIEIYNGCTADGVYMDQYKFNAIDVIFGANTWIKCVETVCYEPYLDVTGIRYKEKNEEIEQLKLNVKCMSAYDVYDVPIYLLGYDQCGELIADTEFSLTVLHSANLLYDENYDYKNEWNKTLKSFRGCEDLNCGRNNYNEKPNGKIEGDDVKITMPNEKTVDDDYECFLEVSPTKISINSDMQKRIIEKNEKVFINYKVFSNEQNSKLIINNTEEHLLNGMPLNGSYEATNLIIQWINEQTNNNYFSKTIPFELQGNCHQKTIVTVSFEQKVVDNPQLKVYDKENNELKNFSWIRFEKVDGDDDGSCDGITYLPIDCSDPQESYIFRVESANSWVIDSYSNDIVLCRKVDNKSFKVQLIDNNYVPCSDEPQFGQPYIKLRNSSNTYWTVYIAVADNLIERDEFVFTWSCCSGNEMAARESETEIITLSYDDYYSNDTYNNPIIMHSVIDLVADQDMDGNRRKYVGGWTFVTKNVNYDVYRLIYDEAKQGLIQQKITSFPTDKTKTTCCGMDEKTCQDLEYDGFGNYNCEESEVVINEANDVCKGCGDIKVYIGEGPNVEKDLKTIDENENLSDDEKEIAKETYINGLKTDMVLVNTTNTFKITTVGYIDFTQIDSGYTIQLQITHRPVVVYDIYTDQIGDVRLKLSTTDDTKN